MTSLAFGLMAIAPSVRAADAEIVVTIRPVHSLVSGLMEGVGTPRLLVEGVASPHAFTLKPSEARAAGKARVLVRVSEQLEPFTEKLVRSLPQSVTVVTLSQAPGLTRHALRSGGAFEAHDDGERSGNARHGDHDHEHDAKSGNDPHIWLDPANARAMVAYLRTSLGRAMPGQAQRIDANAARMMQQLTRLEAEIADTVKPLAGRPFVVFHDAYQYFERRFGVTAIGSVTVSPEVPPSARRLSQLRAKLTRLGAACVFAEPQFAPRVISSIIEGTTARKGTLDPLGAAIPAGPGLYATLMRDMAASLKGCLGAAS
ncbi:MAG: zinc ABC transporter substrate-binding protein [Hyphomicrobiaceae bacterium]